MRALAVAIIIIWSVGCSRIGLKDWTATISAQACAGAKVEASDDGIDWAADAEICAKGAVMGYELPDLCAGVSHAD